MKEKKKHEHDMTMAENELTSTMFSTEFLDDEVGLLFRSVNRLSCQTDRFKNLMRVMQNDLQSKIDDLLTGNYPI